MAIERCVNGHVYDRDWNTECPRCPIERLTTMQRVEIAEQRGHALIRRLMEGYPFQAHDKELHDECKRVLGEA